MREILFRGKRLCNNKWMIGNLLCYENGEQYICCVNVRLNRYKVDPKTVGQYTGLTDKNGNKIFEGDILDTPDRLIVVTWLSGNAQFDCNFVRYAHDIRIENFKGIAPRDFRRYEVIGNIHDNPELLEV